MTPRLACGSTTTEVKPLMAAGIVAARHINLGSG